MKKLWGTALLCILALSLASCTAKTKINSYVLPESNLGGDSDKGIPPIESIIVWPMVNIAVGSKAKGVEVMLTDYLIDTLYLNGTFKSIYILSEDEAKDLMARAGEELGLKKKPKDPNQGGLVTTKVGQLTGTEALLFARLDDYDEVKVDKITYTGVALTMTLYDAREASYPTLDSFTPTKTLWRMNSLRYGQETLFTPRPTLYETSRTLLRKLVDTFEKDLAQGTARYRKMQEQKIRELERQADRQLEEGQYDDAIATWNEVLQLDPKNSDAPKAIEKVTEEKEKAEARAKEQQVREQVSEITAKAEELYGAGDLQGAKGEWAKVLQIDPENSDAKKNIRVIDDEIASREGEEREKEVSANLHLAQKALGELKYTEAIAAARKVLAVEPDNAKAKEIIAASEQKLEEGRAAEKEVTSTPAPPKPAPPKQVEAPAKEAAPAASAASAASGVSEVEKIRNEAMELFNAEEYAKAEEAWKKLLEIAPDDKQAQEMLETTQMLIEALK